MTSEAILTELRALPAAPERLRERVRALPEPKPRFAWSFPRVDLRRSLLVLAPAVVALGVGAAAVHGVFVGGTQQKTAGSTRSERVFHGTAWSGATTTTPLRVDRGAPPTYSPSIGASTKGQALTHAAQPATALPPSATRLNKYEAWLRIRVSHDDLSRNAARAMQIARGYGGYVASVDMNTPGKSGRAVLVLRVPVTKVEDAVMKLGKLGDVTAQHVRIQDLQRLANQQQDAILKLRATIAGLEQRLAGSLSAEQRVQLEFELAQSKRSLAAQTNAHKGTVREGALATISTTLFVSQGAAATHHEGRLGRTLHDAGSFLVRELAWVLYAAIVFGPIALLGVAVLLAVRVGRRRSDTRLLESH
jgi:hypothetical protein